METKTGGRLFFQKRNEKIDWRKLSAVDVDRVALEVDVDAIQDNIVALTYCNIQNEVSYNTLDESFVKLFRLAQLTIEYLLHCQQYLQQCVEKQHQRDDGLAKKVIEAEQREQKAIDALNERNVTYKSLKKDYLKAKKQIGDYQLMIRAGASGLHKCLTCHKTFVSQYYLHSHLERRHPDEARKLLPTVVARDEEKKLLATETELQREELHRIHEQELHKSEEMMKNLKNEHLIWKKEEEEKMKNEMEAYRTMLMDELKQTQKEKEQLFADVERLEKANGGKKSNLGNLVDDEKDQVQILTQKIKDIENDYAISRDKEQEANYSRMLEETKSFYEQKLQQEAKRFKESEKHREKDKQFYQKQIEQLQAQFGRHDQLLAESRKNWDQLSKELHSPKKKNDEVDNIPPSQPKKNEQPKNEPQVDKSYKNETAKPPKTPPATAPTNPLNGNVESNLTDTLSLWISRNAKFNNLCKVSKTASNNHADWSDEYSFNAPHNPQGEFRTLVYVYSCGGSPFWRQYVSMSSRAPAPNYKLDFTFYAARKKLIGTMKLHMYEAGSSNIVHTVLSKSETPPENCNKKGDVWFYVLKTSPTVNSLSRSNVSGNASGNMSGASSLTRTSDTMVSVSDDVSVSSLDDANIEEARHSLVKGLHRSRENILEDGESGSDNDDVHEKMNKTASTSVWSDHASGEFYPYPDNPLAKARFEPDQNSLQAHRNEAEEMLEDMLSKYGVDSEETQMSNSVFKLKMQNLQREQQMKETENEGFLQARDSIRNNVDDFSAKAWLKKKKKYVVKNFKKVAGVVKNAMKIKKGEEKKKAQRPLPKLSVSFEDNQPSENKPSNEGTGQTSEHKSSDHRYTGNLSDDASSTEREVVLKRFSQSHLQEDESEEENAEEVEDSENEEGFSEEEESDAPADLNLSDLRDDHNREEEDSSQWDEDGDENNEDQEEDSTAESYHEPEPYNPKMRSPKGSRVKELTASLEASLTLRKPGKKIAGSVDLLNVEQHKKTVSFKKELDFSDEESDFSLEKTPANHKQTSDAEYVEDDNELDNILSIYNQKPSSSSTPHKAAAGASKRPAPHNDFTEVTDFNDDDDFSL